MRKKNVVEEKSEMLPDGWNTTPELYVLRYTSKKTGAVYMLKVIAVDGVLLVHFWKDKDERISNMNVRVGDYTTGDFRSFKTALTHVDELAGRIRKEIIAEVLPRSPKSGPKAGPSRGSNPRHDYDDPLRVPPRHNPRPTPEWTDPDDPFSIGRGDLDPLGRGGMGGMLFDPMRGGRGPRFGIDPSSGLPGRLPPGAVPPGARFDPFGPPGTHPGQRPGPDPDHMKPPDYDDMFM